MKQIFAWVHRKFHLNVDRHSFSHIKDGVGQNTKKSETVTSESDTDALLDHFTLADVHEGWKEDGLLSIGTFGFDSLDLYNHLNADFVEQRDDVEEGKEELNSLVDIKGFKSEIDKVLGSSSVSASWKPDHLSTAVDDDIDDAPLLRFLDSASAELHPKSNHENSAWEEKKMKKKGERTTLADLFSAETDTNAAVTGNSDSSINVHQPGRLEKTSSCCRKRQYGLSFTKKFLYLKGDYDSLPITKLHQLIKRMLNKKMKIHPELQGKVHGKNGGPAINILKSVKVEGDDACLIKRVIVPASSRLSDG